jgi:diguanylate cyclase (GGDEF)-like protein
MPSNRTTSLISTLRAARRLPSPPGTAMRVLELCRSEETDVRSIAEVVMSDPALAGRLLRYANSSAIGAGRQIVAVRDAVLYLGLRTVKLAALGFSLATGIEPDCAGFSLKRFWAESLATAVVARHFATAFKAEREEALTVGLLAGIGQLGLACGIAEEYGSVLARAPADRAALIAAEQEILGTDHVQFGAELLTEWALPDRLIEAVRWQHQPEQADQAACALAQTVHAALALAPLFYPAGSPSAAARAVAREAIEVHLRLDEERWESAAKEALADYQQLAAVFDIQLDQFSVFDLYAAAQDETARVGMVAQLEKDQVVQQNHDLLRRATTDPLTGVANRARLDDRLKELLAGAARGHGHFALLMFDIDHFKRFNDTHGHAVGDLVLQRVAQTVHATLREVDLLARYGGEEFVILAPHTDQRGACIVAARTRRCVEAMHVETGGKTLQVTISVGLAITSDYRTVPTAQELVATADKQLYLSKGTGRNTWAYLGRSAAQVARAAANSPATR